MDDLYDEFGNYIGGAESDEEEVQQEVHAFNLDAYGEDGDEEEEDVVHDQQLMEVDGRLCLK